MFVRSYWCDNNLFNFSNIKRGISHIDLEEIALLFTQQIHVVVKKTFTGHFQERYPLHVY